MLKRSCTSMLRAKKSPQNFQHFSKVYSSNQPLSYTERQAKTGRPVSPHVTIYAFPITAISSITNRVTGVGLSVGVSGIAMLSLAGMDTASLMTTIGSSAVGPVAKFVVSFPLIYHYLGGVRHVIWDNKPEMLVTEEVEKSSYILFGVAGVSSVVVACL